MAEGDTPPAGDGADPNASAAAVEAAQSAADTGATPESAEAAAAAAAQKAGLSKEDAKMLAGEIVDEFERRGLFEHQAPPAAPTDQTPPAEPAAQSPANPTGPSSEPVEVPAEPPRKRTWAERFVGRR